MALMIDDFKYGRNQTALPPGISSLDWDTKIKDLLPGNDTWVMWDPWTEEKAALSDVLSHVSGLPR